MNVGQRVAGTMTNQHGWLGESESWWHRTELLTCLQPTCRYYAHPSTLNNKTFNRTFLFYNNDCPLTIHKRVVTRRSYKLDKALFLFLLIYIIGPISTTNFPMEVGKQK